MSFQSPFLSVASPESAALEAVLKHRRLILEAIQQGVGLKCFTAEEEQLVDAVKEVRRGKTRCSREFYQANALDGLVPEGGTRLCGVPFASQAPC